MKLTVKNLPLSSLSAELLILPAILQAGGKKKREPSFAKTTQTEITACDSTYSGEIKRQIKQFDYSPKKGKRLSVGVSKNKSGKIQTFRLSGVGENPFENKELDNWRKLGGDAYQRAAESKVSSFAISLAVVPKKQLADVVQAILEGVYLAGYKFNRYRKDNRRVSKEIIPTELVFSSPDLAKAIVTGAEKRAAVVAECVKFARDLVNAPPCDLRPVDIVAAAKKLRQASKGRIGLKIYNRSALRRLRAGALLAVAQGSSAEPYLIHLTYKPRGKQKGRKKIALVGKGITFDSGGLSIKPGGSMETMKCDMAGAACVLGVMKALVSLSGKDAVSHEVHGIIPTAENMINGEATRPGDIVFAMNGKSIEILNTDAEGRLILADALCYSKRVKADITIDLATLTGACVVALGNVYTGLFTKSEELEKAIRSIGLANGELYWPLPIAEEYKPLTESKVANLKNTGSGGPGATMGALFLQEFVPEKTTWAHLDIAGPAFVDKGNDYSIPGATGFGVRTLIAYLQQL